MSAPPTESPLDQGPPRIVAASGVIFSALFIISVVLIRLSVPADLTEGGTWLSDPTYRTWSSLALNLVPFTGIAFLWFIAVLRNRIGLLEDRFFATVFLGSGLLFIAMLFSAAAVAQGLQTLGASDQSAMQNETYRVARTTVYTLLNIFGVKMGAVFMFTTSTIGLRTGVLAPWVSYVGYLFGLVMLLAIGDFAWIALLFPAWVMLVSVWILLADFQHDDGQNNAAR